MTKKAQERSPFGQRLLKARMDAGMTQMQAAALLGISQGTLSQAERTGETSGLVAKFAAIYRVNPLWLTDGSGEPSDQESHVAHSVSHPRDILPITRLAWGELGMADLSGRFELELPNEALAPEFPAGTVMRFDARKPRRPGWPCCVRDQAGVYYVRDYEEGAAGSWRAVARSRGFAPLDSLAHGLEFIAPMYGVDYV